MGHTQRVWGKKICYQFNFSLYIVIDNKLYKLDQLFESFEQMEKITVIEVNFWTVKGIFCKKSVVPYLVIAFLLKVAEMILATSLIYFNESSQTRLFETYMQKLNLCIKKNEHSLISINPYIHVPTKDLKVYNNLVFMFYEQWWFWVKTMEDLIATIRWYDGWKLILKNIMHMDIPEARGFLSTYFPIVYCNYKASWHVLAFCRFNTAIHWFHGTPEYVDMWLFEILLSLPTIWNLC